MHSLHCAIRVFTRCVISQSNWDFILRSYGYGLAIFVDCQALLESERGKKNQKGPGIFSENARNPSATSYAKMECTVTEGNYGKED
jgi:hypothetical protein